MAEHAVGNMVVLTGTIVEIDGDVARVAVDRAFTPGDTIDVRLGKLRDDGESDEDVIRRLMAEAMAHPGRVAVEGSA